MHNACAHAGWAPDVLALTARDEASAPFWLDRPDGAGAPAGAHRRRGVRPRRRRRRFHGPLGGAARQGAGPGAGRPGPRGGRRRRPGQRSQRRHLRRPRLRTAYSQGAERSRTRTTACWRSAARTSTRSSASVRDLGIDCGWERTGELDIASSPWQVRGLRESRTTRGRRPASRASGWTGTALRAEIASPTYWPAGGTMTRRSWTRRASPGDWRARARSGACASARARPSPPSAALPRRGRPAHSLGSGSGAASRARHQCLQAAAPSGCASTSCPCTTTRS